MTAQELAAEMHKFGIITFNRWAIDGAAMLLQQAEQIEALKADAERLDLLESTFFAKRWNGVLDSGSRTTWCIVPGYQHSTHSMVGHTFRAAIDAMRKS